MGAIDAVVFDLFGTLVPNFSLDRFWECIDRIADVLGAPREGFRAEWRAGFRQRMDGRLPDGADMFVPLLRTLGVGIDAAKLAAADRLRSDFFARELVPKPGAEECLEELRRRGYRLALATDCSSETPTHLDRTPLGAFFAVRAVSAHLGVTKPHPAIYEHVLSGLGVPGESCVYVGDGNSEELPGAKRHGMTTVWIDNGAAQTWKERFVPEADFTVRDLGEVPELVAGL
ncbi:MAG: HAD family hydrolase [Planctomycetota bacterium]|jgi:putative hydrolase of the HAD superfamily